MTTIFASTLLAAAAEAGQNPQQKQGSGLWQMIPIFLMLAVLWIMMSSSNRKRARQHEALMKNLKSGDKVATSSGIIGVVVSVKDRSVSIRSEESKFEVLKSAVTEVIERKDTPAEAKS